MIVLETILTVLGILLGIIILAGLLFTGIFTLGKGVIKVIITGIKKLIKYIKEVWWLNIFLIIAGIALIAYAITNKKN